MKVALCLHGNFDSNFDKRSNGLDGFSYIKKNILDKFRTDVFIHSWDKKNENLIKKLYNPIDSIFEKQINFDFLVTNNGLNQFDLEIQPRHPKIIFSHLYSVNEALNLCFNSKIKYDLIIKARFDLGRINRWNTSPIISLYSFFRGNGWIYPVQCIAFPKRITDDSIYVAYWEKFNDGPADMWYYGSYKMMKKFAKLFETLEKELKLDSEYLKHCEKKSEKIVFSDAIKFYKYFMVKQNIWNSKTPLRTSWT